MTATLPTLYYTPSSCGAANYIAAHRAGVIGTKINTAEVNIGTHVVLTGPKKGSDFYKISASGSVPCIEFPDQTALSQNVATLQYIADLNPDAKLAGSTAMERYQVQSYLGYVASELHAACGSLFNPTLSTEVRNFVVEKYAAKLKFLNDSILKGGKKHLVGDHFTVADSYLYIVLSWTFYLKVDLPENALAFFEHIKNLDFVKEAHAAMKLASEQA
jgi:glutathione S-transferase